MRIHCLLTAQLIICLVVVSSLIGFSLVYFNPFPEKNPIVFVNVFFLFLFLQCGKHVNIHSAQEMISWETNAREHQSVGFSEICWQDVKKSTLNPK